MEQINTLFDFGLEINGDNSEVTNKELFKILSLGSGFCDGKLRILHYYKCHDKKISFADFLKNEYGIGGRTLSLFNENISSMSYDAKGMIIVKNDIPTKYSWHEVANKIESLIVCNEYMTIEERDDYNKKYGDVDILLKHSNLLISYKSNLNRTKDVFQTTNNHFIIKCSDLRSIKECKKFEDMIDEISNDISYISYLNSSYNIDDFCNFTDNNIFHQKMMEFIEQGSNLIKSDIINSLNVLDNDEEDFEIEM